MSGETNRNEILFKTLNETTKPKKIKKVLGNLSSIWFDGDDDLMVQGMDSYNKSIQSLIILCKPEFDGGIFGQLIGNYSKGFQIALDSRYNSNKVSFNGSSFNNKGRVSSDGINFTDYGYDVNYEWVNNNWNLLYFEFENSITMDELYLGSTYPYFPIGTHSYKGYINFISMFNDKLNEGEINNVFSWVKDRYGI